MTESLMRVDDHLGWDVESFDNAAPRIFGRGTEDEKEYCTAVWKRETHIDRVAFASGRKNERNTVCKRGMVQKNDLLDSDSV